MIAQNHTTTRNSLITNGKPRELWELHAFRARASGARGGALAGGALRVAANYASTEANTSLKMATVLRMSNFSAALPARLATFAYSSGLQA